MSDGAAVESQVFALRLTALVVADRAIQPASRPAAGGDFIVGPENRFAGQAIQWLLEPDGHCYSPLVVCGAAGTGKSHLVRGVASSRSDAVCTCAADFIRELADAVENKTVDAFRSKYRTAPMLVLEDLQQLAGHRAAIEELRHILDALEARETQVVLTSRLPPSEMSRLPKSLRSRLTCGLVVTTAQPGPAARREILERLAAARRLSLSPGAAKLLAERLNVTAAELNGALLELEMAGKAGREETNREEISIDVEHVRRYLARRRSAVQIEMKQITALVAKHYGVKAVTLATASRRRQAVLARNVAIYLGRKLTGQSLQALGKHFGGRDHTTVLHGYRSIEARIAGDAQLATAIHTLEQLLRND